MIILLNQAYPMLSC